MNLAKILLGLTLICLFQSCTTKPKSRFNYLKIPVPPIYERAAFWAALPEKEDAADLTPDGLEDRQEEAAVDVFYIHPTTYTNEPGNKYWNGAANAPDLMEETDSTAIKYQASLFNGVGRVYAPRYRQAHIEAYYTKKYKRSAQRALDMAYADVKVAFEYYMENYNEGRPIIIAAHSQGTTHGIRLVREFFDGKSLQEQLIAAYLVGMPVKENEFGTIPPCQTPEEIGCFCSWRTFRDGYTPKNHPKDNNISVINPLTWMIEQPEASREANKGAVLRNFNDVIPNAVDAKVHNGLLWVNKRKFPGSFFFNRKNYHIVDYNFYYVNVRENARQRAEAFQEDKR